MNVPKAGILKKTGKAIAWLGLVMLLLIGLLLGLLFVYEDEVKAAIIAELNTHLKAEVRIDPKDIDLTIIKTFPDCSIEFKNVLMLEALALKQKDTLLFAGRLNLHFNINDLWNKRYRIHKIKLKDGVVKLRVLKDGRENYIFWKETGSSAGDNSNLAFDLELFDLDNCRLRYKNVALGFTTDIAVQRLELAGRFGQENFALRSEARMLIRQMAQRDQVFLKEKDCSLSVELDVKGPDYRISKASVTLNRLLLEFSGGFAYNRGFSRIDLSYNAPKLDIASLLSLLPGTFKTAFSDYESSGNFYAKGQLKYNDKNDFRLSTDFGIQGGSISYKPGGMTAKGVRLDGMLQYSDAGSLLSLSNISLGLNNDLLQGSCTVRDFSDPYLNLSLQAHVQLENLKAFLPLDTLSRLKGDLQIHSDMAGKWRDLKDQTFSTKVKMDLNAHISGLEAQFKNDEHLFAVENCSLMAVNREIEVKDLKLKRGSSDIQLNGKLPGFFNYLSDRNSPLIITGNLYSNYLKLEDFMVKYKASGGTGPLIPANVQFQLNAAILKFSYSKFEAQAITGEIDIKRQKAVVSDMKLQTMGGEATIDAFGDNSRNKLEVVLQSKLRNINISQLFYQFNNFGQATLQDKHLKGFASADIDFSGAWSNQLQPDENSIRADCKLSIERGELIGFKPLLSLSKFVDVQDLQHIQFSTLQSDIHIANKTISLPKTSIKNSALNLDFWGSHRFDNSIDYHIQLVISELQARRRKKQDDGFGPLENDPDKKRCAYILMKGTVDDPDMSYDMKGMKQKIREDIKQEGKTVKSILKEEFGLFKKDSAVKKMNQPAPVFQLEKPGNNPPKKALEPKKKDEDEDF